MERWMMRCERGSVLMRFAALFMSVRMLQVTKSHMVTQRIFRLFLVITTLSIVVVLKLEMRGFEARGETVKGTILRGEEF